jgi:hypothetical protein
MCLCPESACTACVGSLTWCVSDQGLYLGENPNDDDDSNFFRGNRWVFTSSRPQLTSHLGISVLHVFIVPFLQASSRLHGVIHYMLKPGSHVCQT